MRPKISVIGAGQVGATFAEQAVKAELGNVVLLDVVGDLARGKALDLTQALAIAGRDIQIKGTDNYEEIKNSNLVVITAGLARQPGMTREDLLQKNAEIVIDVAAKIKNFAPQAIVIVVTNPLDVMTYLVLKKTGFSKNRVIGMAGVLDAGRFKAFLGEELKASYSEIETVVLGVHGEGMLPIPRLSLYKGKALTEILPADKIQKLIERTNKAGAEIVGFLKTGSAFYGPAGAIFEMAEAILKNKKRTLFCSVWLAGEYGLNGVCLGVPVVLGQNGLEKIINLELTPDEKEAFIKSAELVKENIKFLGI